MVLWRACDDGSRISLGRLLFDGNGKLLCSWGRELFVHGRRTMRPWSIVLVATVRQDTGPFDGSRRLGGFRRCGRDGDDHRRRWKRRGRFVGKRRLDRHGRLVCNRRHRRHDRNGRFGWFRRRGRISSWRGRRRGHGRCRWLRRIRQPDARRCMQSHRRLHGGSHLHEARRQSVC